MFPVVRENITQVLISFAFGAATMDIVWHRFLFFHRTHGRCMEPCIQDGDWVIATRTRNPKDLKVIYEKTLYILQARCLASLFVVPSVSGQNLSWNGMS